MNNLITLSCPSCGANLEVNSGAKQFACKYCGSVHVLSGVSPTIDSNSPICPVASHQDVILKVSAIVRTQVFDAPANSHSETPVTYMSQLGKKLICPPKPNFPLAALTTRGGIISFVFIAILLFAILGNAIFLRLFPSGDICGFILFLVVGVFIVTPITKNTLIPILSKKNAEYKERYEQWRIVKNLWDNAYYCQRHDVVFMNGNQQTIPLDKFQSFLLNK